uniref:Uncharacterized protein n=1 Tax=Panagrolaimus davidi TaxID=227884 RepID=A0A914PC74_9BILA
MGAPPPPPPGENNNQYEVPAFGGSNNPPPPPAATPAAETPLVDGGGKSEIKSDLKSEAKSGKSDKSGSGKASKKRSRDKKRGARTEDEDLQSNMSKVQSEIKQPTVEEQELSIQAAKKALEADKKDYLNKRRIKYVKRVKCGIWTGIIILLIVCIAVSVPCSLFAFNVIGGLFDEYDPPATAPASTTIHAAAHTTIANIIKATTSSLSPQSRI